MSPLPADFHPHHNAGRGRSARVVSSRFQCGARFGGPDCFVLPTWQVGILASWTSAGILKHLTDFALIVVATVSCAIPARLEGSIRIENYSQKRHPFFSGISTQH